jgi:hypothetical protein
LGFIHHGFVNWDYTSWLGIIHFCFLYSWCILYTPVYISVSSINMKYYKYLLYFYIHPTHRYIYTENVFFMHPTVYLYILLLYTSYLLLYTSYCIFIQFDSIMGCICTEHITVLPLFFPFNQVN